MIDHYCSGTFQQYCVQPIARWRLLQISPNLITLLALIAGVLSAVLIALGLVWPAVLLLLLSGYFDTLDGAVARLYQKTSDQGCVLDIFCDRVVEFSVIFGLLLVAPESRVIYSLLMLGASYLCVTSFLVVGIFDARHHGADTDVKKSFRYSPGLVERFEAFVFFIAMIVLPTFFSVLAVIYTILVTATALVRVGEFVVVRRLENKRE